jgi:sugar phosphate isomerase/epimerase
VRSEIIAEPARVLAAIRKIGYQTVETFAAQYTRPAAELRSLILDAGFTLPSAHFGYADMDSKFDYAKELGATDVICGAEPANQAVTADAFKGFAEQYNKWGERAQKMGMRFGFHNHNFEFQTFDGRTGLDILLAETDPKLVWWQMDVYWVTQGGQDPVTLMRRYHNRLQTLHFKDRKPGVEVSTVPGKTSQHFTEIGSGTLDFPAIWNYASSIGIKYLFVEQDTTEIPPLESLAVSYRNIKRLLV